MIFVGFIFTVVLRKKKKKAKFTSFRLLTWIIKPRQSLVLAL